KLVLIDALLWISVLPVAFILSSALTLCGMGYGAELAHRFAGELTGNAIECIVFALRSGIFVASGTLLAPSNRTAVAIILGVIHLIMSETPLYNPICWLGTFLGTSAAVACFIANGGIIP